MTSIPATPTFSRASDPAISLPVWTRVSWGAIMTGAVCAIGLQFLFTVLGLALGVSVGPAPNIDVEDAKGIGMVAGAWWLVTGVAALFIGGLAFGRLAGLGRGIPLKLEAAAMWAVVAIFGFIVVASGLGAVAMSTSPIAAMATHTNAGILNADWRRGAPDRTLATDRSGVGSMTGADTSNTADRASSMTPEQRAELTTMAESARRAARNASWWSVFGLVAGLGATIGGAVMGVPGPDQTRELP